METAALAPVVHPDVTDPHIPTFQTGISDVGIKLCLKYKDKVLDGHTLLPSAGLQENVPPYSSSRTDFPTAPRCTWPLGNPES